MDEISKFVAWDVFISYDSMDVAHARGLRERLSESGYRCFVSADDLHAVVGSAHWAKVIDGVLDATPVIILIVTKAALSSKWVEYEWRSTHDTILNGGATLLVPYCLSGPGPAELPRALRQYQCVDARTDATREDAIGNLLGLIRGYYRQHPTVPPEPAKNAGLDPDAAVLTNDRQSASGAYSSDGAPVTSNGKPQTIGVWPYTAWQRYLMVLLLLVFVGTVVWFVVRDRKPVTTPPLATPNPDVASQVGSVASTPSAVPRRSLSAGELDGFVIHVLRTHEERDPGTGRRRTLGTYRVTYKGQELPGLKGVTVESKGPGSNIADSGQRIEQGGYPLSTYSGNRYATVDYATTVDPKAMPKPALGILETGTRPSILIHPGNGFLTAIGTVNLSGPLAGPTATISYPDSRARVVDLINALRERLGSSFPSAAAQIPNAWISIAEEPSPNPTPTPIIIPVSDPSPRSTAVSFSTSAASINSARFAVLRSINFEKAQVDSDLLISYQDDFVGTNEVQRLKGTRVVCEYDIAVDSKPCEVTDPEPSVPEDVMIFSHYDVRCRGVSKGGHLIQVRAKTDSNERRCTATGAPNNMLSVFEVPPGNE